MTMQEPDEASEEREDMLLQQAHVMQALADSVLEELIDEISRGLCLQTHRAAKFNYMSLVESAVEEERNYLIVDRPGHDVFGESSSTTAKKTYECVCPHCERPLVAQRFAPHLEKCMGMGRNSSRIASKRIANTGKAGPDSDLEDSNDKSSDNDWNEKPVLKKARKRRERSAVSSNGLIRKVHKKHDGPGPVLLRNSSAALANGTATATPSTSTSEKERKSELRMEAVQEFQF